MAAQIITVTLPNWAASGSMPQQLAASLTSRCLLNAGGEVVDRDPLKIADLVAGGGVWVDYGGYPMYYRQDCVETQDAPVPDDPGWHPTPGDPLPPMEGGFYCYNNQQGPVGFSRFLTRAGLLFDHTFMTDDTPGYPYRRGLVVRTVPLTVPSFVVVNQSTPMVTGTFSCFGMKHPSGGWYFWAFADQSGQGVEAPVYAAFIQECLAGKMKGGDPTPTPPAGAGGGTGGQKTGQGSVTGVGGVLGIVALGLVLGGGMAYGMSTLVGHPKKGGLTK